MGKILSGPKAPTVQYVVQNPVTTTSKSTATSDSSATDLSDDSTTQTDSEISSQIRTASLLRRSRGRLGTVSTSFRGFLDSAGDVARKTLLGE